MRPPDLFRRVEYRDGRRRTYLFRPCSCGTPKPHPSPRRSRRICDRCRGAILDDREKAFLRAQRLGDAAGDAFLRPAFR
jgi:hypothetical protein